MMRNVAPARTELFLHGREGEDLRFKEALEAKGGESCAVLLFPDDTAITIDEYLAHRGGHRGGERVPAGKEDEEGGASRGEEEEPPLIVIAVDATWRKARRMMHHFTTHVSDRVPHVQLSPTVASVYARTQTLEGRICTVEAISLLLSEYGESPGVCQSLIECVKTNNAALDAYSQPARKKANQWFEGGHPAWYYGDRVDEGGRVVPA